MNPVLGQSVVGEEYILPCNFHDLGEGNTTQVQSLKAQFGLSLDQAGREDAFSFDSKYSQQQTQIVNRELGGNDKSFFLVKSDILSDTYQQFGSQNSLCYIPDSGESISCIDSSSDDKCAIVNSEIDSSISSPVSNPCQDVNLDIGNSTNAKDCYVDSKCFMDKMDSSMEVVADKCKSELPYFTDLEGFTQSLSCHISDNQSSITKTLRNIKRLPPPPHSQQGVNLQLSEDSSYMTDSCYDVFSCTVLIDTSGKNEIDFNSSIVNRAPNKSFSLKKKSFTPSGNKAFKCLECGKQFREKSHLYTHSRAHTDIRKFKCTKCELSFKTEVNLRFHMNSHNDEPLDCPQCDKQFMARRVLSRHIRVVHSLQKFECEQCGKKFKTKRNLINHYGIHSGVRPYICNMCSKSFLHSSSLNTHMREHTLQSDCFDCKTSVNVLPNSDTDSQINIDNTVDDLTKRKVNDSDQHCVDIKQTVCECGSLCTGVCQKVMECGERTSCEHVSKPFLCSICGKPFKLKSSLISHMKTHNLGTEYRCDECGKRFVKKVSYEIHMKQHRGERPEFMCDQCSLSYHSQFNLKRHYLKHITTKNFQCQICDKKFWMKDALQVHLRSHSKERNFKCNLCDKCFSHKSSLVTHMRSFHSQTLHTEMPLRSSSSSIVMTQR